MDSQEFRKHGKEMIDFVADYWDTIRERQPLPDVQPGYIWNLMPNEAPKEKETWEAIFGDLNKVVVDANTHWHHPHFFAYYPTANSYPAILGDILSAGLAPIGFTWKSSPSCTELELVITDWFAKMIGLPSMFLNQDPGPGAGIIQCTASDSTLVALLAARARAVKLHSQGQSWMGKLWKSDIVNKSWQLIQKHSSISNGSQAAHDSAKMINPDSSLFPRLVAYCSDQAHSSVDKAALLAGVKMRKLQTSRGSNYSLKGETLAAAIKEDRAQGLIPFYVVATVGTTPTCAVDDVASLGKICQPEGIWLHVDAAYAGSAAVCPEYRYLTAGTELVDSFNFNAHKWLLVNFDCSPMWFRDATEAEAYFSVDPLYLKHEHQNTAADYRHLQIGLGRRFRSLKAWFVIRSMGISGLQTHIRSMCVLAQRFADLVAADSRFEIPAPVHLGLVCFRLKGENAASEKLLKLINEDRRIHLVPAKAHDIYFLRLAICSTKTTSDDILFAWKVICELTERVHEDII
uniref:Aromatic-L-amino-acid decarboxylase n=1 Tax=Plectus sambesii TaxID=2011161 RepID=A0A914VWP3_9BILA